MLEKDSFSVLGQDSLNVLEEDELNAPVHEYLSLLP